MRRIRNQATQVLFELGYLMVALVIGACGAPQKEEAPVAKIEEPGAAAAPAKKVLESRFAGSWYEADAETLAAQIQQYLDNVPGEPLEEVQALILPHAGYRFSGQTAAYGIKQLVGRSFSRVVVLGVDHGGLLENIASVPDVTHYATPLGETPLDLELIATLRAHPCFTTFTGAHLSEHSVQIEVPLLQHALGEFRLVPILVGRVDEKTARAIGAVLAGVIDAETLVVASCDFTHYGPDYDYMPFKENVPENIKQLDMGAFEYIEEKDVAGFLKYLDKQHATICGRSPVAVLLSMLPQESQAHQLHYDTSGNLLGDFTNSVSYLSVAFTGQWPKREPVKAAAQSKPLQDEDKHRLLRLARETLTFALQHRRLPEPDELAVEITPGMEQVMGAFVTLHEHGELRGCIGEIEPRRPVYKAVMAQAVNAGINDRRFPPVQASELADIDFEISAYASGPMPVASPEEIELGRHGVVLEKSGLRALFLPQVAPEQGWDLEETLEHLSMKAGLPPDGWKEGASFSVFEAIVFSEQSV